jgi:hypothetical protein
MPENKNNPVYAKILSIFLHKKIFFDLFIFLIGKFQLFLTKDIISLKVAQVQLVLLPNFEILKKRNC